MSRAVIRAAAAFFSSDDDQEERWASFLKPAFSRSRVTQVSAMIIVISCAHTLALPTTYK